MALRSAECRVGYKRAKHRPPGVLHPCNSMRGTLSFSKAETWPKSAVWKRVVVWRDGCCCGLAAVAKQRVMKPCECEVMVAGCCGALDTMKPVRHM